jgi:uncharacterized damage-inducible protein DinB
MRWLHYSLVGALKDTLLVEYDHEMAATRRLLERVPGDKLDWSPHGKSRSLRDLAAHVCAIPAWGRAILETFTFDLAGQWPPAEAGTSLPEMLASFDRSSVATRSAMHKTDAEYLAVWALTRGEQEVFTLPRIAAFRTFVLYHLVHHRGQLSVYLRLNDVAVPAMYGPTADER